MKKRIVLIVVIFWAGAAMAGFLYLGQKITAGELQLAAGQKKVEQGQTALDEGKVKLEFGKQELSEGKKEYDQARDSWSLALSDKLLNGGKGFKAAETKIADGNKRVAQGENKVNAGERRLDAGEQELSQGREQLDLAKGARVACGLAAAAFASLAIVLGFWWKRSLFKTFQKHPSPAHAAPMARRKRT